MVVVTIIFPVLLLCILSMLHGHFENVNASYDFFTALSQKVLWKFSLLTLSESIIVSFIGDIILLFWFCLRRWLPTRRGLSSKTFVMFLVHLLVTALAYTLFILFYLYVHKDTNFMPDQEFSIAVTALLIPLAFFPLCVLVYARHSLSTTPSDGRAVSVIERDLQTPGQEADPPFAEVSLPADTTEHAPDLLCQSEATPL